MTTYLLKTNTATNLSVMSKHFFSFCF